MVKRRWKIRLRPSGRFTVSTTGETGRHHMALGEVVEVMAVSEHEALVSKLEGEIKEMRQHAANLRAEDFDPDVVPAALVQKADRLEAILSDTEPEKPKTLSSDLNN